MRTIATPHSYAMRTCAAHAGAHAFQQLITSKTSGKTSTSPAGNRTPVSRVTGGDTDHYTTEDLRDGRLPALGPMTRVMRPEGRRSVNIARDDAILQVATDTSLPVR